MKIRAHPGICEGHGLCKRFAPEVYELDEEGYIALHLVEVPPELERAAELGASICPARAITIIRDEATGDGTTGGGATRDEAPGGSPDASGVGVGSGLSPGSASPR